MSIDLQDPVSVTRAAGEAVQRHVAEVADRARDVDLHAPVAAARHARKRANRAAKHIERQAGRASEKASRRVRAEVDRVSPPKRHTGRRLLLLVVVIGGAAAAAMVIRRRREAEALAGAPDPFGRAVVAVEDVGERDPASMTPV